MTIGEKTSQNRKTKMKKVNLNDQSKFNNSIVIEIFTVNW